MEITSANGTYCLGEELPRGGTCRVYRARRAEDATEWAVKLFDVYRRETLLGPRRYMPIAQARAEFAHDAALLGQFDHPQIPHLEEHGTLADGQPVSVLTYIPGQNLAYHLHDHGALHPITAAQYGAQLCAILDYLHARLVAMGAGKPVVTLGDVPRGNVLIGPQIVLCDFGAVSVGDAAACQRDQIHVAALIVIMMADDVRARPHDRLSVAPAPLRRVLETALGSGYATIADLGAALRAI